MALLGFIQGNEEVGYYNAAYRIKDVMVSIVTSLGAVLLPRLSYYIENNMWDKFNNILSKSTQFIFILSLPLVVFCIFICKTIRFDFGWFCVFRLDYSAASISVNYFLLWGYLI